MKRVCFLLFGQLRYWEYSKGLKSSIELLESKGYEVDLVGTFWNDKYSESLLKQNKLTIFNKLNFIQEPKAPTGSLLQYYYCLREGIELIQSYNKKYDFYICARPDLHLTHKSGKLEFFDSFVNLLKVSSKPTFFHFDIMHKDTKRLDDKIFIVNNSALAVLKTAYNTYIEENEDAHKKFTYHRSLGKFLLSRNVKILEQPIFTPWLTYDLCRHAIFNKLGFDDSGEADGINIRTEAKKLQTYDDTILFVEKYKKEVYKV